LSFAICHLPFVHLPFVHLPFAICHLSFVIAGAMPEAMKNDKWQMTNDCALEFELKRLRISGI
jgi:hypothetical protein